MFLGHFTKIYPMWTKREMVGHLVHTLWTPEKGRWDRICWLARVCENGARYRGCSFTASTLKRQLKQWIQCRSDPLRSLFSLMFSAYTTFFNVRSNSGNA